MTDDVFHIVKSHSQCCRSIGVREDDTAILPIVIFLADAEILIQCHPRMWDPEFFCPYRIEGITDIREQDRFFRVKEGHECHSQHIIRANSHKHLLRLYVIILSQCIYQHRGRRVRITAQRILVWMSQYLSHAWSGRIGILVGVQFDHLRPVGLFSRCVGSHLPDILFPCTHLILFSF